MLRNTMINILNNTADFNGNANFIPIDDITRVGSFFSGKNRPIKVAFRQHSDLLLVLRNRMQLSNRVYVREDYPSTIEDRRRILRPILKCAHSKEKYRGKCKLYQVKLFINGKRYTVGPKNNLDLLPQDLLPETVSQRENDDTLAFFG